MGRGRQAIETAPTRRGAAALCALCLLFGVAWPAAAQDPAQLREYDACMEEAMNDPELGFERASGWAKLGGGDPAHHCAAIALYALGHFEESATRLERLAESPRLAEPSLRAPLLSQAGNAWLMAGNPGRSHAALSVALEILPDDPDLLIDRSLALAAAKNYWPAVDDLDRVLDGNPENVYALTLRASAYRYLDQLELARDDAERALALDPENVSALLERGNIRRLQGDGDGARDDWIALLQLEPDGPVSEAARHNLERLDLRVD
jgi:tetratricopeptide (TPR) repeat protein